MNRSMTGPSNIPPGPIITGGRKRTYKRRTQSKNKNKNKKSRRHSQSKRR